MSASNLLLWMSARVQGSWAQFRAAVEELHLDNSSADDDEPLDPFSLPMYQALRLDLQRLGHAEFFAGAGEAEWRVTPPSLAVSQAHDRWIGVLAGARSTRVVERFRLAAAHASFEDVHQATAPRVLRAFGKTKEELEGLATDAGLLVQIDAPTAILMSLPAIDDPSIRLRVEMPFGSDWKVERFSPSELGWRAASVDDAKRSTRGLFRFTFQYRREILLCARGSAFRIPAQVGKYLVLRKQRRLLRYERSTHRLSIPSVLRPPFLIERGLVQCSGFLPEYEAGAKRTGTLHYRDVPEVVAQLAAGLLRQDLQ